MAAKVRVDRPEVVASQVSVRDLKTHLSEWLGRVQAGEVLEVTSHRKPIARITAVKPAASVATDPLQKAIDAAVKSAATITSESESMESAISRRSR